MSSEALRALSAAWMATVLALTLFAAVVAVSPFWDRHMFLMALQDTLALDGDP